MSKRSPYWRNRIVGHADVDPNDLLANPDNWRVHPKNQQASLSGVLNEVGVVQSVIVNKRSSEAWPSGQRGVETLVDGHLRVTLALRSDQTSVPVTFVDLDPDEEATVLATLDPIGAMARADHGKLDELIAQVSIGDPAVQELIAKLSTFRGEMPESGEEADAQTVSEQWMVVIECASEAEQAHVLDRLIGEGYRCRALVS